MLNFDIKLLFKIITDSKKKGSNYNKKFKKKGQIK